MSVTDLGRRIGVRGPAITALERSECDGTAQLNTLRRAAQALDCTLIYAFIPNSSLEDTVNHQATAIARRRVTQVLATMSLEDQAVSEGDLLVDEIHRILTSSRLWKEESYG